MKCTLRASRLLPLRLADRDSRRRGAWRGGCEGEVLLGVTFGGVLFPRKLLNALQRFPRVSVSSSVHLAVPRVNWSSNPRHKPSLAALRNLRIMCP